MREPAVSGRFYRRGKDLLREQVRECFLHRFGPGKVPELAKPGGRKIRGAIFPHAGFEYSGPIAAHTAAALAEDGFPKTFIIIGPNHHGFGAAIAVSAETYSTPMGKVEVDAELARKLCGNGIEEDPAAHAEEHSVEVQLPFLQYFSSELKFVPIVMGLQDVQAATVLGERIARFAEGDVVVVASTDFTHAGMSYSHMPPRGMSAGDFAKREDAKAIERIQAMDPKGLIETVRKNNISMCGYGCVAAMLTAVRRMGAKNVKLLKYATSADVVPGDREIAVGYGSFIVH